MAAVKTSKREISLPGFNTCEQAAKKLRMKADTIRRYVHRGLISAGIIGSVYLIADAEVQRFRREKRDPGRPKRIS